MNRRRRLRKKLLPQNKKSQKLKKIRKKKLQKLKSLKMNKLNNRQKNKRKLLAKRSKLIRIRMSRNWRILLRQLRLLSQTTKLSFLYMIKTTISSTKMSRRISLIKPMPLLMISKRSNTLLSRKVTVKRCQHHMMRLYLMILLVQRIRKRLSTTIVLALFNRSLEFHMLNA